MAQLIVQGSAPSSVRFNADKTASAVCTSTSGNAAGVVRGQRAGKISGSRPAAMNGETIKVMPLPSLPLNDIGALKFKVSTELYLRRKSMTERLTESRARRTRERRSKKMEMARKMAKSGLTVIQEEPEKDEEENEAIAQDFPYPSAISDTPPVLASKIETSYTVESNRVTCLEGGTVRGKQVSSLDYLPYLLTLCLSLHFILPLASRLMGTY